MNKTITFTVTAEEHAIIKYEAACKGKKPSTYAKDCLFANITKYPAKGIFTFLNTHDKIVFEDLKKSVLKQFYPSDTKMSK